MHTADHLLLHRWIAQRDAQAFKALTAKHCAMVYGTCVRILRNPADAEDVTQECFTALASASKSPSGSMGAWLHRMATYQALNKRRSEARRLEREGQFARSLASTTEIQWNDVSAFIDQSIEALPDKIRAAVFAYFIEDEPVTVIAQREGVTHGAISQRIQKGVALIRDRMERNGIPIALAALAALLTQNASAWSAVPASVSAGLGKLALSGSAYAVPAATATRAGAKALLGAAASVAVAAVAIAYFTFAQNEPITAAEAGPEPEAAAALIQQPLQRTIVEAPAPVASPPAPVKEVPPAEPAAPDLSTWQEVVAAHIAHQEKIRRIKLDYRSVMKGNYYDMRVSSQPGFRERHQRGTLTTDGDRAYIVDYSWGNKAPNEFMPEDKPQLNACAWDGYTFIQYDAGGGEFHGKSGLISITPDALNSPLRDGAFEHGTSYLLFSRFPGHDMFGFVFRNGLRVDEVCATASEIRLRPEMDDVNGSPCYVVEAVTPYGVMHVWFDSAHDFNIAKFAAAQRPGDDFHGQRLVPDNSFDYEYEVERYVQIGGLWAPSACYDRERNDAFHGQYYDYVTHTVCTNIELLDRGEDDGAYVLDASYIINGSELRPAIGERGPSGWVWFNDRFVQKDPNAPKEKSPHMGGGFGAGTFIAAH